MNFSELFGNIDIEYIAQDLDFKEDSVREVIVLPILKALGYEQSNIVRSKTLQHPFLRTGSKKRPINLIPDYVLKVENSYVWVLDAKAPNQNIKVGDNVEQVYSYATHPEIRSNYFALCNGLEFSLFKTVETNIPILCFPLNEISNYWEKLNLYLSPNSFQDGKKVTYESINFVVNNKKDFDYNKRPLLKEIPVKKQQAKRHFGVHGYFTKQSWNVVAEYIKNYSQIGDVILDPFGGSGVTAIEALMNRRKAISIDINPMAVFIVNSLLAPIDNMNLSANNLSQAFERIKKEFQEKKPLKDEDIDRALKKYPYPQGVKLPKGSDVDTVDQLFSKQQLAELSLLKSIILKEKKVNIRHSLLLMFSGLLNKINLTYHASKGRSEGRGNSSIFAYYRYRIAKEPAFIDTLSNLESRFKKVVSAKIEIEPYINQETITNAQIIKGTATNLSFIGSSGFMGISTANSNQNPLGATVTALPCRQ